jgi:hypothetical protein
MRVSKTLDRGSIPGAPAIKKWINVLGPFSMHEEVSSARLRIMNRLCYTRVELAYEAQDKHCAENRSQSS